MIAFSNCKINIGLQVKEKRPDGFHEIETVFYPVPLYDILEIIPSEKLSFEQTGIQLNINFFENIVFKAYRLLKSKFKLPPVTIYLHKVIPSGAGLGGGSSNAANTLLLLNTIFELSLSQEELMTFAAELGSDCPFFIKNSPVLAKGRGEIMNGIELDLSGKFIVIVKPDIHISTAEAYLKVQPVNSKKSLNELLENPIERWKECIVNDFEKSVFSERPKIKQIKDNLYKLGADYALMSGSGSAVYGIYSSEVTLENEFEDCFVWKGML